LVNATRAATTTNPARVATNTPVLPAISQWQITHNPNAAKMNVAATPQ